MPKLAIVRDGVVEAVIVPWEPPAGTYTVPVAEGEAAGPGWSYEPATGAFSPPPPDPETQPVGE